MSRKGSETMRRRWNDPEYARQQTQRLVRLAQERIPHPHKCAQLSPDELTAPSVETGLHPQGKKTPRRLSPEERLQLAAEVRDTDKTYRAIAAEWGVSCRTIPGILRRVGAPGRRPPCPRLPEMSKEQYFHYRKLRRYGWTREGALKEALKI